MFYSKSTGGFYDTAIHGDNIPADAVEITAAEHQALIDGQAAGKRIISDANGNPVLSDPEDVPFATLQALELSSFRTQREMYLNRLAGITVAAMVAGDTATAQAAGAFRQGLLDLPARPAVVAAQTIDELRAAMKAEYAALVAAAPDGVRDQFRKVDN